jgi:hypothetical protein
MNLREEYSIILKEMKPNITKNDRELFSNLPHEYPKPHDNTILSYLRGEVSNLDIAYDMISFFREIINKRMELVNSSKSSK